MSLSAAVIDALVQAGATVEQLAAAVKADLAEAEQRSARQIPWPKLRQMAFERDGHKCVWCDDEEGPFEIDHVISKANGGEDTLENVCVSCRPCNRAKKDRDGEEWEALRLRRQKDRDRKRAERADKRGQSKVVRGKKAASTDAPPNDIYSNPPENPVEAKASTAPRGRADRGSKISEDWQPPAIAELSPEAQKLAVQWPASAYRAEAEAFRNFWLAETRASSRKSNWNRAWCNRIVDVHGKVMRQAKFAADEPAKHNDRPLTNEELKRAIQFNEDQGNKEKAAAYRFQLQARTALSAGTRQ